MGSKQRKRTPYKIIGITGTPGVGKKTIAPLVAKALDIACVSLNELANDFKVRKAGSDEAEVDTAALKRKIEEGLTEVSVIYGHLLPYVIPRRMASSVAVLRCDPAILKNRLVARGYPSRKIVDNVEAELIGLVSAESFREFGSEKTFEVDTSSMTPFKTADEVLSAIRDGTNNPHRLDWTAAYDSGEKLRSLLSFGS